MAARPTLKDLRTTYRVLTRFDAAAVPQSLLVALAERIRAEERQRQSRKIARMTEEQLISYQEAPMRKFRVNLPDGRIIHERTNEATFYAALREVPFARLLALDLRHKERSLFVGFDRPRRLLVGHRMLSEGCFVWRGIKAEERVPLLRRIDESLQLGWDITFMH